MTMICSAAATGLLATVRAVNATVTQGSPTRNEFNVVSDPGVEIFVREIVFEAAVLSDVAPIILIHGARVPGLASFDLPVAGGSLAVDLAARGFRVFVMDARGYGRSTRPSEMTADPKESLPLVRSHEVARDIDAVVQVVATRTGRDNVALLGWATGGQWAGFYASLHPERVGKLVLLNALYGGIDGHALLGHGTDAEDPRHPGRFNAALFGGYRLNTAAALLAGWDRSIPVADKSAWRDQEVADAYVREALASDPAATTNEPPAFRAPSGAMEDSYYLATGRQLWDAASITAHVLVVRGEFDFWSRPADVEHLESQLVRAGSVRTLTLANATHFLHLDRSERGRDALIEEVVALLRK